MQNAPGTAARSSTPRPPKAAAASPSPGPSELEAIAAPWAQLLPREHLQLVSGLRAGEVLAERALLPLVVRADAFAVEHVGRFDEVLEREPAHALAVLHHERHVVGPHLERRLAAGEAVVVVTEPRVEETGVVGAQLTARRVVPRHRGRNPAGDRPRLGRQQQVDLLGLEHEWVAALAAPRPPVVGRIVPADGR